jgi:hypothetical protein
MFLTLREPLIQDWLYGLRQWERERIAEVITALLSEPRPPAARAMAFPGQDGEQFQISVADRRVTYNVYRDEADNEDWLVVVHQISDALV